MKSLREFLAFVVVIFIFALAIFSENFYVRYADVIAIDGTEIFVEDGGEVWSFYSNYNFEVGQKLKLLMNNNRTDTIITDDEIARVLK